MAGAVRRRRRWRLRRRRADRLVRRQSARIRGGDRRQHRRADRPVRVPGSAYDEELRKNFAEITAADVFEDRPTPESLFDSWPLKR